MAISKINIVNKALALIGAKQVTTLSDTSSTADLVNSLYEISLKSVLAECKWNFATKRDALPTNSTATLEFYDVGETIIYDRPTDIIRIYSSDPTNAKWREEQDYIISDSSGFGIRYVYFIEDTTKFPIYFVEALCDKLAGDMAYSIVNSSTLAQKFIEKYEKISLPRAISQNSQTGVQQTMQDDAWELAKYSNVQSDA
jgi:hypothetical protein